MSQALVPVPKLVFPLMLYGSGDLGTERLRRALAGKGVKYVFRDIRDKDRVALTFMQRRGHASVPQLYDCNNVHIGDFDGALMWLEQVVI